MDGMCSALSNIKASVQDILAFSEDDAWAIDYLVALIASNTWGQDPEPVWGYLVGPPGCGKTELLRVLDGNERYICVDELTENALASVHTNEEDDDPSLLKQLDGKILVVKDFSTFSGQNAKMVEKTLATLRAAYDGSYSKVSGTAGTRTYLCRFGTLIATVPSIDNFLSTTQKLGERFVLLRLLRAGSGHRAERLRKLRHTRSQMAHKAEWRSNLRSVVQAGLSSIRERGKKLRPEHIIIPPVVGEIIDNLADLICRLRTHPIDSQPTDAESGSRLVQQLINLAKGRALADNRNVLDTTDIQFIRRVAHDSLPSGHSLCFRHLRNGDGLPRELTLDQAAAWTHQPISFVSDLFHQWAYLGLISEVTTPGALHKYRMTDETHHQFTASETNPPQVEDPQP